MICTQCQKKDICTQIVSTGGRIGGMDTHYTPIFKDAADLVEDYGYAYSPKEAHDCAAFKAENKG